MLPCAPGCNLTVCNNLAESFMRRSRKQVELRNQVCMAKVSNQPNQRTMKCSSDLLAITEVSDWTRLPFLTTNNPASGTACEVALAEKISYNCSSLSFQLTGLIEIAACRPDSR